MKKAQVTKADVLRFKEWLESQMVCDRTSVDARHYPAFQEMLEEYDDRPLVWQIKKPLFYKWAQDCKTGGTIELGQGESYVEICGEKYIQNDKEALENADPRRKNVKLLFQKTAKLTDLAYSYHSIPPEYTALEEYPHFYVKPWNWR